MFVVGDKVSVESPDEYNGASGNVHQVFEDGCNIHLDGWTHYEDGYFFAFYELRKVEG